MRMARAAALIIGACLLAACATDTVVLLPKDDGSTGAIVASRDGNEVLLDQPYAMARAGSGGVRGATTDRASVERRFGAALSAMPVAPSSYVLYFDSGSDEFNDAAKATAATLLADLQVRPAPEVTVIGHTDRVGSDADNDRLSLQRAESVRAMLIRNGIKAPFIRAVGRGEREPLVPSADEQPEARNRRVEVTLR
jgi:outer membrane protein OmpA-like peptidoglycan-associated protein